MDSPRARIKGPLEHLLRRLRALNPASQIILNTAWMHALREYGVACYELGQQDLTHATTLPAPAKDPRDG
jgi:hypothetical protein